MRPKDVLSIKNFFQYKGTNTIERQELIYHVNTKEWGRRKEGRKEAKITILVSDIADKEIKWNIL